MLILQLWPNTAPLTQKASVIALDTTLVDLRCCHRVMEPDNRVVKHSQTYQDSQGCVLEPNHFGAGAHAMSWVCGASGGTVRCEHTGPGAIEHACAHKHTSRIGRAAIKRL